MQSIGGVNLECADCKANFSSASLLLKHFGEHIIGKRIENESSSNNKSCIVSSEGDSQWLQEKKEEEENGSILEGVLKQTSVHSLLNVKLPLFQNHQSVLSTSSCASPTSESQNSSNSGADHIQVQEENCESHHAMVLEIGERAREKQKYSGDMTLIKFDLQKRLENCVSKLSSKQDNTPNVNLTKSNPIVHCGTIVGESERTLSDKVLSSRFLVNSKNVQTGDFNPLKFCMVTLEEKKINENVKAQGNSNTALKRFRGASSRKQLMPKKIHRPLKNIGILETPQLVALPSLSDGQSERQIVHRQTRKKYLCHICSKSFGWSTDLKRHILTHTGERPFKCQMCEATFTRNFLLQKHESRVHNLVGISNSNCLPDDGCALISKNSKKQSEADNTVKIGKSQPVLLC